MPWMVYTIVFLVTNTTVYIVSSAKLFAIEGVTYNLAGNTVAAQVYVCK